MQLCSCAVAQLQGDKWVGFYCTSFCSARVISSCPEQYYKATINIYLHYDIITIFYYLYLACNTDAITVHLYYKISLKIKLCWNRPRAGNEKLHTVKQKCFIFPDQNLIKLPSNQVLLFYRFIKCMLLVNAKFWTNSFSVISSKCW